jgi:hypothetical protein
MKSPSIHDGSLELAVDLAPGELLGLEVGGLGHVGTVTVECAPTFLCSLRPGS